MSMISLLIEKSIIARRGEERGVDKEGQQGRKEGGGGITLCNLPSTLIVKVEMVVPT